MHWYCVCHCIIRLADYAVMLFALGNVVAFSVSKTLPIGSGVSIQRESI